MKKLIIGAAAAMVGAVAFGGLCDTITPGAASPDACRAYYFKASVKVVDGKKAIDKASNICAEDGTVFYRVGNTRKIKGVFFDCDTCNLTNATFGTPAQLEGGEAFLFGGDQTQGGDFAHFYLSTSASKYKVISHTDDAFQDTYGDYSTYNGSVVYDFKILNFFGGPSAAKSKKAEALIAIDFAEFDQYEEVRYWSILCAGFGAQDKGLVKNLSGAVAGAMAAANWCGIPTTVFEPCLLHPSASDWVFQDANGNNVAPSPKYYISCTQDACVPWSALFVDQVASWSTDVVSGTWALKYNAAASKAAYGKTVLDKVFGKSWDFIENKKVGGNNVFTPNWTAPLLIKKNI